MPPASSLSWRAASRLGSWLATALAIVLSLPFLLYRAITEDRMLQAELPGYRDYAGRVRWRLCPGHLVKGSRGLHQIVNAGS